MVKFNGWQIENMKKMIEEGKTYRELGSKFGCSGRTIRYWIDDEFRKKERERSRERRRLLFHKRGKHFTREQIERISELRKEGKTLEDIAKLLNCSASSVSYYINKELEKITPEPIIKEERPEVTLKMPESLSLDDLIPTGGAVVTKIGKTNIVMANDRGILKIYTPVENSIIEVEIAKTLDNIIKRVDNWMKLEKAIESSARTFESMGRERAMERIKDEESKKG